MRNSDIFNSRALDPAYPPKISKSKEPGQYGCRIDPDENRRYRAFDRDQPKRNMGVALPKLRFMGDK